MLQDHSHSCTIPADFVTVVTMFVTMFVMMLPSKRPHCYPALNTSRFQDGKISEAVVWEGVPFGQRHKIPDLAVSHILLRHLPPGTVITSSAAALDALLYAGLAGSSASALDNVELSQVNTAAISSSSSSGSSNHSLAVSVGCSSYSEVAAAEVMASRAADAALDALTKHLRTLSDLVLKVIGVQPLSSVTRHTCCFYPQPHPLAEGSGSRAYTPGVKVPRVLEAIPVMVQLESTGESARVDWYKQLT